MTPGPVTLILILFVLVVILIYIAIVRWVFRINEFLYWTKQIHQRLEEISNQLKK